MIQIKILFRTMNVGVIQNKAIKRKSSREGRYFFLFFFPDTLSSHLRTALWRNAH